MLFKKYADPFSFLDGVSEMGQFAQAISQLLKDEAEAKLWELYLHSYPNKSFNDWKKDLKTDDKALDEMTDEDINTAILNAQKALNLQA